MNNLAAALAVHPHVCGEHDHSDTHTAQFVGSSPRVWGTWIRHNNGRLPERFIPTCVGNIRISAQTVFCFRFIPTCVGNIPPIIISGRCVSVHPHVCGEHMLKKSMVEYGDGSSPRVWGTWDIEPGLTVRDRFIPTCVGNIYVTCSPISAIAVHPHVCGEHVSYCLH